tara:strand:- start:192 stop:398 length:207 start_codon:yes stop_codon:yes gene_type:complete
MQYFDDKAVDPPKKGVEEMQELRDRFYVFLMNDWVHMERRVAALDAQVKLLIGMTGTLVGLMVYVATR